MEAKSKKTVDQTKSTDSVDDNEAWVSPDVRAAQAGERVEMGKDLSVNEDNDAKE